MSKFLELMRPLVLSRVARMPEFDNLRPDVANFTDIFKSHSAVVIAEIKYQSPKGRVYSGTLSPIEIAKRYYSAGAKAISVLTEPHYFAGDVQCIAEIHQILPDLPILMKDFVLSTKQVQAARALGASSVLLIVNFLSNTALNELYHCCLAYGLTPLLEVHDRTDLERALELQPQPRVLGINNRNLKTLMIDCATTENLLPHIPQSIHVISESGIESKVQLNHLQHLGCDGFLIGSHLMRHPDPGAALEALLQGAEHAR